MITDKQVERMIQKLKRFENTLAERLFTPVDTVDMKWYKTAERLHSVPNGSLFSICSLGDTWGGENSYCWFRGEYTPQKKFEGQKLYLYPKTTFYESMLWINGEPKGIYAAKFIEGSHGNHYCDMITMKADSTRAMDIALECYAGNFCIGSMPLENDEIKTFKYEVGPADICLRDEQYAEFLFDLKTVIQLAEALSSNSFRRADIVRALTQVHKELYYSPEDVSEEKFRAGLEKAQPYLKKILGRTNSETAGFAGIIGHSHMDTAWLWTIDETVKKCARTFSNQLSLMEQYPEYLFIQSSAYHTEMIRENYPGLFDRMRAAIAEGRYEPNGGVWVECDCNIPTGEMMARQFLWGQRYTRTHFGYTSDTFWLPDTFGYSAAIPQIMKQSGIKYFLTTKMAWNDTTQFPYDSFWWRGIDGTKVLTHLNKTHIWPDPKNVTEYLVDGREEENSIKEKFVTDKRLLSFGYGDGGGGPQFEMLEMARRIKDLEGMPRTRYRTVSAFMQELENTVTEPSVYSGELYLELHRGTLTNQHQIKRNNRLAEIAVHNLEYVTVRESLKNGFAPSGEEINPLINTLLINQFHDILPGTCIPQANKQSIRETGQMIEKTNGLIHKIIDNAEKDYITLTNTTSFNYTDRVYIPFNGMYIESAQQQIVDTIKGKMLAVSGLKLPPLSSVSFKLTDKYEEQNSVFNTGDNYLETPFAKIEFDEMGFISSFRDKTENNRELRNEKGYPLGTLLYGEDVPTAWDNWDIDVDLEYKLKPVTKLTDRQIISQGGTEFRIRSKYELSEKSSVIQDMVFFADSPAVKFETKMNWQNHHRFLRAAFDTTIFAGEARHEIQFGHVKRATTRNTDEEKAKFEVCMHKYSDISDTRYGITLLNDCKYGVSVQDGSMRLSLHKGGTRPDYEGDLGEHYCEYAFLPHKGGFSAQNTVKPAYNFNYKPLISSGKNEMSQLLELTADNIVVETIKPCEDSEKAYIVRLYECEGAFSSVDITVKEAKSLTAVNLLEEKIEPGENEYFEKNSARLVFHPFEIKTLKIDF